MHYTKKDIEQMNRIQKIKFINSVSGIKPANLIGTISNSGQSNLAIFSSVFHLGSNPALLGFITRPAGEVPRHTYENILDNKQYTINHVSASFTEKAHYTSAKIDRTVSEFETCGLTEEFVEDFKAPFVKESILKMGMEFKQAIDIELNGTILVIGEIQHLIIPDAAIGEDEDIDLANIDGVGISGLNTYYSLEKIGRYPYARASEIPDFKK
ncbi:flavin oxidoreductase [Maribacter algarum]|uniref:Flavin oxidoreductase n=1 Tax=Maribacter algarum (ex Zhang et al. 2020) TaxID=2578118 RepID=A0A5S3PYG3_9FLAO|nr:flavin reductase [Maribacter algarum]TMM59322.1 flavin oxidoreductase [Maribacter algarum]